MVLARSPHMDDTASIDFIGFIFLILKYKMNALIIAYLVWATIKNNHVLAELVKLNTKLQE